MSLIWLEEFHEDMDGGFDDAIATTEPVTAFTNLNKAIKDVIANSKPEIYDQPYDALYTGKLTLRAISLNSDPDVKVQARVAWQKWFDKQNFKKYKNYYENKKYRVDLHQKYTVDLAPAGKDKWTTTIYID